MYDPMKCPETQVPCRASRHRSVTPHRDISWGHTSTTNQTVNTSHLLEWYAGNERRYCSAILRNFIYVYGRGGPSRQHVSWWWGCGWGKLTLPHRTDICKILPLCGAISTSAFSMLLSNLVTLLILKRCRRIFVNWSVKWKKEKKNVKRLNSDYWQASHSFI